MTELQKRFQEESGLSFDGIPINGVHLEYITWLESQFQVLRLHHVSGQLEPIRTDFCLWYYAQSQPLDAHKVVDWFASNLR